MRLDAAGELDRQLEATVAECHLRFDDVHRGRREAWSIADPGCERRERPEAPASDERLEALLQNRIDEILQAEAQHEVQRAVPGRGGKVPVHSLAHAGLGARALGQLREQKLPQQRVQLEWLASGQEAEFLRAVDEAIGVRAEASRERRLVQVR